MKREDKAKDIRNRLNRDGFPLATSYGTDVKVVDAFIRVAHERSSISVELAKATESSSLPFTVVWRVGPDGNGHVVMTPETFTKLLRETGMGPVNLGGDS